jgi:hypothetical protein
MAHLIGSETPSDAIVHPIWLYRLMPALALIALILAQTIAAKSAVWHDMLIGFATGILIVLCVASFGAKAILFKDKEQSSDVHRYPLT